MGEVIPVMQDKNDPPLHGQEHWNLAANASRTPGPSQSRTAILMLAGIAVVIAGVVGYRAVFVETDPWCERVRSELAMEPYAPHPDLQAYDERCR